VHSFTLLSSRAGRKLPGSVWKPPDEAPLPPACSAPGRSPAPRGSGGTQLGGTQLLGTQASPSPFPEPWLCCHRTTALPWKMSTRCPAAAAAAWPTPAPWDPPSSPAKPRGPPTGKPIPPSSPPRGAGEAPAAAARTWPRSLAEVRGAMGFNAFSVVAKFKTLYRQLAFLYLGEALQRCILLPWIIKQKLSDNEALGSQQLLSEWEPGCRRPAPAAAALSAPRRRAAIGTGLPLSLPVPRRECASPRPAKNGR